MLLVTGSILMLMVPAYFVLQPVALVTLRGKARIAALLPLIPAVPILLWCAYAFADQSNLWPLTFILFAPFGSIYLAIVLFVNRKGLY